MGYPRIHGCTSLRTIARHCTDPWPPGPGLYQEANFGGGGEFFLVQYGKCSLVSHRGEESDRRLPIKPARLGRFWIAKGYDHFSRAIEHLFASPPGHTTPAKIPSSSASIPAFYLDFTWIIPTFNPQNTCISKYVIARDFARNFSDLPCTDPLLWGSLPLAGRYVFAGRTLNFWDNFLFWSFFFYIFLQEQERKQVRISDKKIEGGQGTPDREREVITHFCLHLL